MCAASQQLPCMLMTFHGAMPSCLVISRQGMCGLILGVRRNWPQARVMWPVALCRPEAFAALREIEDAMRIIEKAESPLGSHPHRTFNNTFWEPGPKVIDDGLKCSVKAELLLSSIHSQRIDLSACVRL